MKKTTALCLLSLLSLPAMGKNCPKHFVSKEVTNMRMNLVQRLTGMQLSKDKNFQHVGWSITKNYDKTSTYIYYYKSTACDTPCQLWFTYTPTCGLDTKLINHIP